LGNVLYTADMVSGRIFQSVLRHVAILQKPELAFVTILSRVTADEIARTWVQILTQSPATHGLVQSTEIIPIGRNFHLALKLVEIVLKFGDDFARIQLPVLEATIVLCLGQILKRFRVIKPHAPCMEIFPSGLNFRNVRVHVETVLRKGIEIVPVRSRCMVGTIVRA
jgi:hypothetical protein